MGREDDVVISHIKHKIELFFRENGVERLKQDKNLKFELHFPFHEDIGEGRLKTTTFVVYFRLHPDVKYVCKYCGETGDHSENCSKDTDQKILVCSWNLKSRSLDTVVREEQDFKL